MLSLLSSAGRAFLRGFAASLLVFGLGVAAAPDVHRTYLLGVAALVGAIIAGLRAVQAYTPRLSLAAVLGHPIGDFADAFLRAFVAALIVTLPGVLGAPDLSTARALAVAALLGAFNAAVRAVQGLLTTNEWPAPSLGLAEPPNPYSYQLGPPRPRVRG